jgi:CDP-diglyceride synthetase
MDIIFADIFIVISLLTLLTALLLVICSVWHSLKVNKRKNKENGIPVSLIGWGVVALMIVIALPALLIGGFVNMCLITALIMLLVATGALLYSKWSSAKRGIAYLN